MIAFGPHTTLSKLALSCINLIQKSSSLRLSGIWTHTFSQTTGDEMKLRLLARSSCLIGGGGNPVQSSVSTH